MWPELIENPVMPFKNPTDVLRVVGPLSPSKYASTPEFRVYGVTLEIA